MPDGVHVLLGVSGSVAAFKAGHIVTGLRTHGAEVRVAMTPGALHFVTPELFRALSGHPVATSIWGDGPGTGPEDGMQHLSLGAWATVVVVAPASANVMARLAHGFADDPLTSAALATAAPLVIAPAMEARMWRNPATQANADTLRGRGAVFIGPEVGRLASGHEDEGRMAEPDAIVAAALQHSRR